MHHDALRNRALLRCRWSWFGAGWAGKLSGRRPGSLPKSAFTGFRRVDCPSTVRFSVAPIFDLRSQPTFSRLLIDTDRLGPEPAKGDQL